jgi:hypothetical protein
MSLIRDAVKGFALAHVLPVVGVLFSLAIVGWGAYEWRVRTAYHNGYQTGATVVRDSAKVAAQRARVLYADSLHRIAQQGSAVVTAEAAPLLATPRHTPRFEALTVPVTVDTSLVGVSVESTGEHFILPRAAARYWYVSDSLVGVAQQLLQKYAAANAQWRDAWTSEHEARIGADSLVAMYAERLRSVTPAAPAKQHRLVYATIGAVVALVARNQIHR